MSDKNPFENWPQPEDELENVKYIPSGTPEQIQSSLFLLTVFIRLVETDTNHVPQLETHRTSRGLPVHDRGQNVTAHGVSKTPG